MFTSLQSDSSFKQSATFLASLFLQSAVLVVLSGVLLPQMSGPSLRSSAVRSASVTPLVFHKDTIAAPSSSAPEPAPSESHLAPELPSEAKPSAEPEVTAQAETTDDSAGKDGPSLVPFPSWSMNPLPSGAMVFGHQIKTALAVFTPEPPILHGEIPELARGRDVVMNIVIDAHGSISHVDVLQEVGSGVENSIIQTLREWIFVPAKMNGMPIASRRQLRFHFPG